MRKTVQYQKNSISDSSELGYQGLQRLLADSGLVFIVRET